VKDCVFHDVILQQVVQKLTVNKERETISKEFGGFEIEESTGTSITLF